jgi:chorismate mutase
LERRKGVRIARVTDTTTLADFRRQLDELDTRLMTLLLERQTVIRQVIEFKKPRGIPAVHLDREDAMLERASNMATDIGLDPQVARQVLRAVIDAFTRLEREQLG